MHAHSHMVNLEIYMMCLQFRLSAVHVVSMGGIGRKSPSVCVVASSLLGVLSQQDCSHYRKWLICRVPNSLPCAKRRAHGKQPLCRVPKIKHTANPMHTAKLSLCRVPAPETHGKNQTHGILPSLPCAVLKTHGKPRARATHVRRWRTEVDGGATEVDGAQLCRVLHGAHGKQATSPCAIARRTANKTLRRVLFLGTRQTV